MTWWATALVLTYVPNPFLAEAKVYFQTLDYAKCTKRLEQSGAWASTVQEQAELELYWGLCRAHDRPDAEIVAAFSHARQLWPQVSLPSSASPRLRELFAKAEAAAVTASPPPPPAEPPRLLPARRVGALVAVGLGAVGVGVGAGLGLAASAEARRSGTLLFQSDVFAAGASARGLATAANVAYAAAGVAALTAGVLLLVDWVLAR